MYGLRTLTPQVSQYGQATMQRDILQPQTSAVIGAFAEEATSGIGTFAADRAAGRVKELEKTGSPLTEEQYKESPNFSVPYYRGITEESAVELKKFDDQTRANAELISAASSGQFALGLSAGFVAGVFEPKNVATGLATSMVLTPLAGSLVPAASSLRRLMKLRATANNYGGKVALGAVEGGVSAAIAEPSNRYSAKILRQDYTMADTAWNIALSTAFGVGASAAGIGAKEVPKFVRDKLDRFKADTMNVVAHEIDTATNQLAMGQRVDVAHVESLAVGDVTKQSLTKQIQEKNLTIDLTSTKYFDENAIEAAKAQNTKSRDVLIYMTPDEFLSLAKEGYSKEKAATVSGLLETNTKFNDIPNLAFENDGSGFAYVVGHEGRHRAMALKEKGVANIPVVLRSTTYNATDRPTIRWGEVGTGSPDDFIAQGWKFPEKIRRQDGKEIYDFPIKPDELKQGLASRASENKASITKAIDDSLHPDNDTAIDAKAIAELEAFEESLALKKDEAALEEYNAYLKEVSAMKRQGLLSEADEIEMMDAINSVDEKELNKAYEALQICLTRG